ncbi:hypothetical protein F2P81_013471 [Scophthalmus maximus]|uniref:Uncharacterized protein n=1 Tax=Scophthalmus maximus TaxID=52904 RepID=A0A6A4SLH2_SCOMX|nr:hypothetical protein F2P81_013471 [Scophthalmus maximus]
MVETPEREERLALTSQINSLANDPNLAAGCPSAVCVLCGAVQKGWGCIFKQADAINNSHSIHGQYVRFCLPEFVSFSQLCLRCASGSYIKLWLENHIRSSDVLICLECVC